MTDILKKLDDNAERWLLLVFYVTLVITMSIEVLRRELLEFSSIWGEEIVRYSFIYIAWIGCSAAVKQRAHIRIDVLMHYVSPRIKAALYIFGDIIMLGIAGIAFVWSFESVMVSYKFGSVSHGLRISMVWFLAAVPIGFTLTTFRLMQSLTRDIRDFAVGKTVFEGDKLFD